MGHAPLIVLHATSGLCAFAAGCIAVRWRTFFGLYISSLVAMVTSLALVVAGDWSGLERSSRLLFAALEALGVYMLWRSAQACRVRSAMDTAATQRYVHDIGFTLIALFVGFTVIAALDVRAPGWLAGLAGVAAVAGGRAAMDVVKTKASIWVGAELLS